jgi:hypothetical protein
MRMAVFGLVVMGMLVFVLVGVIRGVGVRMFMLAVLRVFGFMTMFLVVTVLVRMLAFVFVFTFVRHFLFSASANFFS